MKYIEAPNYLPIETNNSIFLAGGITGVRNFQKEIVNSLNPFDDLTVCNPRRENFEIFKTQSGYKESLDQIKWEYKYLRLVKQIVFWFNYETIQPIVLFELGSALERNTQDILIGGDKKYIRRFDVEILSKLAGYNKPVIDSFDKFIETIVIQQKNIQWINNNLQK